jgi:hypothetical protein
MSKKNCIFSAFLVKNEFFPKFDDTEWFVPGKSLDTATLKRSVVLENRESVFFRLIHFFFGYSLN